ncbi:MAG: DNA mismatch repair endonuclease MutL [Desulfovibrionales bacterium]|nr:DNA mismatch repair endonuclease MutL [Desulfovibrionales bacterium]
MLHRPPIRSLPIDLQNQIAAGEVVERPASVLKELVENALDAQATRIRVHIRDGGQSFIKVSDNGYGIAEDQLALALTRHATSKISSLNDLTTIHSFGFRGEALPSIASVSRFSLASALADGEGMAVESVFGTLSQPMPASLPQGTDIEVRDLFANVPARLKFLKQPATEARKCSDVLMRMALAHPHLDVELLMGERSVFHFLAGQSLAQRLGAVWPPQLLHDLAEVNFSQDQLTVTGLAGAPALAQARADRIYMYVNKRPVQDKTMLSAVREAYRGRILGKEYPQAVIFLELPPEDVDVNVHPAKTEVRFQDEGSIFQAVRRAIIMALDRNAHQGTQGTAPRSHVLPATALPSMPYAQPEQPALPLSRSRLAEALCAEKPLTYASAAPQIMPGATHQTRPQAQPANQAVQPDPAQAVHQISHSQSQPGTYLGQILDTYLVLAEPNGLTLLDQHAAHERVLYALLSRSDTVHERQPLLIPLEIPLHPSQMEELHELFPRLHELGFTVRLDGSTLFVQAVPALLSAARAKAFVQDVLHAKDRSLHDLWAMLACKSAIKAGTTLSRHEALALIESWRILPERQFCPHGRPVAISWNSMDLEKLFKRRP